MKHDGGISSPGLVCVGGTGGHDPGAVQAAPGLRAMREKMPSLKNTLLRLKVRKSSQVYF